MDLPPRNFIPFRKRDLVEMLLLDQTLPAAQEVPFREFCQLLQSIFHFEFHQTLEELKDAYAPLNPDRDTRAPSGIEQQASTQFVQQMEQLLQRANYDKLTDADLKRALAENSLFKLRLHVDFDDFEEALLFTRGEHEKRELESRFFGLWRREVVFANFDRVVIYIKFRPGTTRRNKRDEVGLTLLKLFQNVPRADIEMLFPNTRLGMRTVDKLIIGVPAVAGGIIALSTKVGASLLLLGALLGYWLGLSTEPVELSRTTAIALLAGIGGLGSFIWKQFSNFRNRKLRFLQSLTQNLYFKNLDNNAGVFHRLVDDAEEEECKEAMLAYFFLLCNPGGCDRETLDCQVEAWFRQRWDCRLDFEIGDALDKLERLGLVETGNRLIAKPLDEARRLLDARWDNFFTFNAPQSTRSG